MGRRKNPNSRRAKAERKRSPEAAARLADKGEPNRHVIARREAFGFVKAEKGGSVDQDICDAIGQLHALGLLSGHAHDGKDLRDIGREYAELYWERYEATAPKVGSFERHSPGTGEPPPMTRRYERFNMLDAALPINSMDRVTIQMLLTNHFHSDFIEGWVQRLIDHEMLKRGKLRPGAVVLLDSPTHGHDCTMLGFAVRGLCKLIEAGANKRRMAA